MSFCVPTRNAMTRDEQENFVHDLIRSIGVDIVNNIRNGKVPEHWDGRQLRQYISDKMVDGCDAGRYMTLSEVREYRKEILTNNPI